MTRAMLAVLLAVVSLLVSLPASAVPLALRADGGARMLELAEANGDLIGRFTIENSTSDRIQITGLSLRRGAEQDGFAPRDMTVQLEEGTSVATLEPGAKKAGVVRWTKPRGIAFERGYAMVLVHTADSETPVALGVSYRSPGGGDPALPWIPVGLVLVPLLGALGVLGAARRRDGAKRAVRTVVGASAGVSLLLALYALLRFDPALTRFDGSEGFFVLYRRLVGGVELGFGLDGLSLSFALLLPLLVLAAVGSGRLAEDHREWSSLLLAHAGLALVVVSLDVAGTSVGLALVGAVIATSGGFEQAPKWTRWTAPVGAGLVVAGLLLLPLGVAGLTVEGGATRYPTAMLELSRVLAGDTTLLGGVHRAVVVWPLLVLGTGALLGLPLLGAWARPLASSRAALAVVVVGGLGAVGGYLLLRTGALVFPMALAWSTPALAVFGAVAALVAALEACRCSRWSQGLVPLASVSGGLAFVAIGSLTAIGLQAAVVLLVGRALGLAGALGVRSALAERVGREGVDRVSGLAREHPLLALVAAVAAATLAGLPCDALFVGVAETVVGSLPSAPVATLITLLALGLATAAAARAWLALGLGKFPEELRGSSRLVPFAGKLPPLRGAEKLGLLGFAALTILLGVAPRGWLLRVDGAALDHGGRVNPPGALEVVQTPTEPVNREARRVRG